MKINYILKIWRKYIMPIDELKQYLKENLTIEIENDYVSYEGNVIKISLYLDGEKISSDYVITESYN